MCSSDLVHEYRLGVRTTDPDGNAVRAAFRDAFSALYTSLVDEAARRWPGVPVVATGHLTVGREAIAADAPQAIHQVGRIEALPVDLLDSRLAYVALGHIHRSGPVSPRAWYSGSPIALSVRESATPRRVVEVELGHDVRITPVDLPVIRENLAFSGSRAEILSALSALTSPGELPPLLQVRVVDDPDPLTFPAAVDSVLAAFPEPRRPILIGQESRRSGAGAVDAPTVELSSQIGRAHV